MCHILMIGQLINLYHFSLSMVSVNWNSFWIFIWAASVSRIQYYFSLKIRGKHFSQAQRPVKNAQSAAKSSVCFLLGQKLNLRLRSSLELLWRLQIFSLNFSWLADWT